MGIHNSFDPMVESSDELSEALVEVIDENPECYWKTKSNGLVKVDDMTDAHLYNLYNYLHRAHEATKESDPKMYEAFFGGLDSWNEILQNARIIYIFNKVESVMKKRGIPFEKKTGFLLNHEYLFKNYQGEEE